MKVKLLTLAGLAAAYLLAAQFGLALQASGTAAAWPFWPPAGLGLAAVLWLGWRAWPGVLLGAFVAGLAEPAARPAAPLVVAAACAGAAIGSTLEALAGAWLVRRFAGGRAALERPQAVFWLVALGALLSAIIGPTLRLGSFWLAGLAKGQEASNLWWAWWRAEVVGVVLVAPWLMALGRRPVPALDRKRLVEFLALEALLVLLCQAIFEGKFVPQTGHGLRSYLLLPILLWPALRFGQAGTTTSLMVLSSLAAIGTARGLGPFAGGDRTLSMLTLQGFIGVSAVMALVVAAGAAQRERTEGQLRASERQVRDLNASLERRVGDRTALLQAANKELEAFAYSVSHDLRAPLRSMLGFSQILLERHCSQLDANGQDLLRRTCESCRQMEGLIEDLLNLSRVGRSEILRRPVDLSAMAGSIAAELRAAEPGRAAQFLIAPNLRAEGDERLLRIALQNLMSNAWKFTRYKPRACIEVGSVAGPQPAFFVRDNGAGFDMARAGRLFGVFQRLHSTSEFSGSGIGLATVQRILSRHGGRAWAVGAVQKGATFYFTLPLSDPDDAPMRIPAAHWSVASTAAAGPQGPITPAS